MKALAVLFLLIPIGAQSLDADKAAAVIRASHDPKVAVLRARDDKGFSELAPPIVKVRSLQFPSPDVAIAEVDRLQYGSVSNTSVTFIVRLERRALGYWAVAAVSPVEPEGRADRQAARIRELLPPR